MKFDPSGGVEHRAGLAALQIGEARTHGTFLMPEMTGVVTIVQEGRFQLTDEAGVSHHFVLSSHALAETEQLTPLARRRARVRVKYKPAKGIIAFQAQRIELLDAPP